MFDSSPSAQTRDLGASSNAMEEFLVSCGFWGNPELRERHGYVLSPSAYVLSAKQHDQVERLARTTYRAVQNLNESLCGIASRTTRTNDEARFLKLATAASRGLCQPADGITRIPPVFKVDLVQDQAGNFSIAEVDTYNPRGFSYGALLEEGLPAGDHARFPGIAMFEQMLHDAAPAGTRWFVIVSEFERYYGTAFRFLVALLRTRGVDIDLIQETAVTPDHPILSERGVGVLAIPDTLNQTMRKNPHIMDLSSRLVERYRNGELFAFFPPVAYLSSKGFLPFLREEDGMDEFIPETVFVGRRFELPSFITSGRSAGVLKATVSSGMKKVIFSALDQREFENALREAQASQGFSWILQEKIEQARIPVVVFNDAGERETQEHCLRVIAFVSEAGIMDLLITGRPDEKVHGAKDCIQLPVLTH